MEWNGKLYVAWRTQDPDGTISVASAVTMLPGGLLVFDSTEALPETGTDSGSQVELTPMFVKNMEPGPGGGGGGGKKPPFGGASQVLAIFVLKHTTHEWSWLDSAGNWSTFRLVKDAAGNVLTNGTAVAGVAVWPNRAPDWPDFSSLGFACGVFPQRLVEFSPGKTKSPATAHFLCYDKEIDRWNDLTSSAFQLVGGVNIQLSGRARPGIAFHTLRESGSLQPRPEDPALPLGGDQSAGQFWISLLVPTRSGQFPQLLVSDRIDRTRLPSSTTRFRWVTSETIGHPQDVGEPLYEDGDLSALKGLEYQQTGNPGTDLWFLPFVDGTYGADFSDGNDWLVIEGGVCTSLWSDTPSKCVAHWAL
jgi:hypothetical protein